MFSLTGLPVVDIVQCRMRKAESQRALSASVALFLVVTWRVAFGQQIAPQIPAQLSFLPSLGEVRKNIYYETWGEFQFPPSDVPKRGQYWSLLINLKTHDDRYVTWNALKPTFVKNGWTVVKEFPPGSTIVSVSKTQNRADTWAAVDMLPGGNVIKIDMIVVGPPSISLTLAAPAATPEKLETEKGDFPYLKPMSGSKFHSGSRDRSPFWVVPKGASQKEMVASTSLVRSYSLSGLSNVLFMTVYREALTKAGWEIVDEFKGSDASLIAHYAGNGRNIWASLHNNSGGYDIAVADTGNDLGDRLAKNCHVALYGVLFDFNKSTLQSTSDAVLQQVANLLNADKTLKLEVQGHTDGVGDDVYNQKLSEDRAHSVAVWFTAHGVATGRLTSKGYGKTMPVADNSTDPGRAKNRRVEIANTRCTAKTPAEAGK